MPQQFYVRFKLCLILFKRMHLKQAYFALSLVFLVLTIKQCACSGRMLGIVSTNRTETLFLRCPNPRAIFFSSQTNESQSWARSQTAASLNWNGDALIYDILTNDSAGVKAQIEAHLTNSIIYVVFMVIGFLIMLIFGPIMICCCCKPHTCPPCCRKQVYTSCQKIWPAVVIVLVSFIAIGSMIGVLIVNGQLQKGYSETRCSTSIFLDDLINGNFTQDQSQYFVGLKPLKANLTDPLSSSGLKASASSPDLNAVEQQIESIRADVENIPNNNGQQLQLKYVSPINSDPLTVSPASPMTNSKLVPLLGKSSEETSLIGKVYNSLGDLKQAIKNLVEPIRLGQSLNVSNSSLYKYAELVDYVEKIDKNTDTKLEEVKTKYIDPISIIIYIIAGLVVLFCTILITSTVLVCSCDKLACRNTVYCSCVVLTILGLLCFVLSVVMSGATVGSHYGCHYVDGALQTKAQFEYRFKPIFNDDVLTKMVAQCVTKQSTGIILNSAEPLQQLGSNGLSLSQITGNLATYKQKLTETIKSYQRAEVLDLDSLPDIKILWKLSDSAEYACSATGFAADSWVPSTNQLSAYAPCKVSSAPKVTNETCPTVSQFEQMREGCQGCIDTTSILQQSSYQDVLNILNMRYALSDCLVFNQELSNVWNNYYKKKADALGPVQQRSSSVSDRINRLISLTSQLNSTTSQISKLTSAPLEAVITRLSCKVLGQDLSLVTNTFCTQIFNYAFKMRILYIIGSFCLLLLMFCATCFGMRTYHSESKAVTGTEKDLHSNAINSQNY